MFFIFAFHPALVSQPKPIPPERGIIERSAHEKRTIYFADISLRILKPAPDLGRILDSRGRHRSDRRAEFLCQSTERGLENFRQQQSVSLEFHQSESRSHVGFHTNQ